MRVYKCWTWADWIRKALSTLATLLKLFVLIKIRTPFKILRKTLMKARRGGKWQSRVPSPSGGVLNRGTNTISSLSISVLCSRTVNDTAADVFLPSQVNSQREAETRACTPRAEAPVDLWTDGETSGVQAWFPVDGHIYAEEHETGTSSDIHQISCIIEAAEKEIDERWYRKLTSTDLTWTCLNINVYVVDVNGRHTSKF